MSIKHLLARLPHMDSVEVPVGGHELLELPLLNKGTAFSEQERHDLKLVGLLPPHIETIEQQIARCYEAFQNEPTPLEKHVFLRNLQDENETLFYRLVLEHIKEMQPIIYTPVVGEACQKFSHIYRRPRGLFISWPERDDIDEILANCPLADVQVIVVTDAERILGLGDQGAGGMGIPIGKLSLYTAIGGIHPANTLPIMLDAGTNNPERLKDPEYIGWRHERVTGQDYDDFVETFVTAVMKAFPDVLLQFEDFASSNAERILERYRDRLCTFNDDIQGTAAVGTGTLLAAVAATGTQLDEQRIVVLGAGSAGMGISQQMKAVMIDQGMSEEEAGSRFYMLDSHGLIHDGRSGLNKYKQEFQQAAANLADWQADDKGQYDLLETVTRAHPTIVVGATGQPGIIGETVVREMAKHCQRPIIFPLSNPTSRCEALPSDLVKWTDGRVLVATGSPFDPVPWKGRSIPVPQCNNSYIFPAMGLGVLACRARRVTNEMFMAAAMALRDGSPALQDPDASLLPPLNDIRQLARHIALAVARKAVQQGVADSASDEQLEQMVDKRIWQPDYVPLSPAAELANPRE